MGKRGGKPSAGALHIVGKKRKRNFKPALSSPYMMQWDAMSNEDTDVLLTRLRAQKNISSRKKRGPKKDFQHPHIVFGVNEVTKALEKDELALVMCCRNIQPFVMIQHIPVLCQLKKTFLCSLGGTGTSFRLGKILGLRTIMAIGFRKTGNEDFKGLLDFCIPKAADVTIPWLQEEKDIHYISTTMEPRKKQQKTEAKEQNPSIKV